MENSRQGLLDRYSFNRLLTCTCPQDFLNCRCNMDCKPSIVFFFFSILPGTSIEYVIKLACIQWAYICAFGYLFRALPQVSYDINDLHIQTQVPCMIMSSLLKKRNTTKVVAPNAFTLIYNLGYNDHFIYFVLIFYCSIPCHVHSLFFAPKC